MYELKRRKKIIEHVKLGDEILEINIDPEEKAQDYQRAQADIIKAQDAIKEAQKEGKPSAEVLQRYGEAIVQFLGVIFGQKNTEKILAFYESRYVEMSGEILPFVVDVIKPRMDKAIAAMRGRIRDTYKKAKYGDKWNLGSKLFR